MPYLRRMRFMERCGELAAVTHFKPTRYMSAEELWAFDLGWRLQEHLVSCKAESDERRVMLPPPGGIS